MSQPKSSAFRAKAKAAMLGKNLPSCGTVKEGGRALYAKGRVQKPESRNLSARGVPPPLLNGRENLAKKVNGKGGYPPSPHSGRNFF